MSVEEVALQALARAATGRNGAGFYAKLTEVFLSYAGNLMKPVETGRIQGDCKRKSPAIQGDVALTGRCG